jgi:hypothetical protein
MSRKNREGRDLKRVLEWLLNRDVPDVEMAAAVNVSSSTFGRRKTEDDYPTFEELGLIGAHFDISARMLQIAFGHRGEDELVLLTPAEIAQYVKQGGTLPDPSITVSDGSPKRSKKPRFSPREDADPL